MIRVFKHYVPHAVLLLGLLDFFLLLTAAEAGWILRARQIGMEVDYILNRTGPLLSFAIALQTGMIAVGVYGTEALQSIRFAFARLLVAISLGVIFLSVMHFILPGMTLLFLFSLIYLLYLTITLLMFGAMLLMVSDRPRQDMTLGLLVPFFPLFMLLLRCWSVVAMLNEMFRRGHEESSMAPWWVLKRATRF